MAKSVILFHGLQRKSIDGPEETATVDQSIDIRRTADSGTPVSSAIDIVSRIQRVEPTLSPAERRVAETVRQDFEAATRLTIAELARRAGVSQPSVTRFCRSVGSRSFGEFKIQLATTLTVASAYLKSDRIFGDDVGQLAQSVMMNAANAIREGLDQLDTVTLGNAIDALATSRRIDIYGQGSGSAAMAEDAKLRLFRLSIPVAAYSDGHQQRMSAATLQPGDAAFAISNSGRSKPVIEAIEIARSFGATTVALTRPGTPLAATADIAITVTVPEIDDVLRPSASRYAHMAIVDTIATGVAARLGIRGRDALRRVRYALTRVGVAIPSPSTDPTPIMKDQQPKE
jgi:DNA-binding MurR/RpiR family transcriptional regulator